MLVKETAERIKTMDIRGAGLIARAAVEALRDHGVDMDVATRDEFIGGLDSAATLLLSTRPTAVSLPNALHFVMKGVREADSLELARSVLEERAEEFITRSRDAVKRIGMFGAQHIKDGDTLMTHCNSQVALACILEAHREGKELTVYATEVRPRNQGILTIRTLNDAGIRTRYIVDSAARWCMNEVDLVVVGSDAITVNGAVVNKIGTSLIALAAYEARTRVIVAAETYKFAPRTILGELIEIEERPGSEVLPDALAHELPYVTVKNPSFDITPAQYIDLIITEVGAIPPAMAFTIIREYLGWDIDEFQKTFEIHHQDQE